MARSVVFYEQSLVDAMRIDIGSEVSESPQIHTLPQQVAGNNGNSDTTHTQFLQNVSDGEGDSSAEPDGEAQPKSPVHHGCNTLMSKKALMTTPATANLVPTNIPRLLKRD